MKVIPACALSLGSLQFIATSVFVNCRIIPPRYHQSTLVFKLFQSFWWFFLTLIWLNCAMNYFSRWHQSTNFKLWWHRPPMQLQQYRLFHTALVHCRAWPYYVKSYRQTFLLYCNFNNFKPNSFYVFQLTLMGKSTDCSLWYPCYL